MSKSKGIVVTIEKNVFHVYVQGKIFFSQPIINSKVIPPHISPRLYWYLYVCFICRRFGISLPLPSKNSVIKPKI